MAGLLLIPRGKRALPQLCSQWRRIEPTVHIAAAVGDGGGGGGGGGGKGGGEGGGGGGRR